MTCKLSQTWIPEMLWDRRNPAKAAEWERHLAQCPECKAAWQEAQAVDQRLQACFQEEPGKDFARIVMQKAALLPARRDSRPLWWTAGLTAAATAMLLMVWAAPRLTDPLANRQSVLQSYAEDLYAIAPSTYAEITALEESNYAQDSFSTEVASLIWE